LVVILDTCFLVSYFSEGKIEAVKVFNELFKKSHNKKYGEILLFDYILDEFISRIISKTNNKQYILLYEAQLNQLIEENKLSLVYTDKNLFNSSLNKFRTHKDYCASLTDEILINYFKNNILPLSNSIPKHIISYDKHFKRGDLIKFINNIPCT
jgi:predicted nucleic acid-binding protein